MQLLIQFFVIENHNSQSQHENTKHKTQKNECLIVVVYTATIIYIDSKITIHNRNIRILIYLW